MPFFSTNYGKDGRQSLQCIASNYAILALREVVIIHSNIKMGRPTQHV